MILFIVLVIAVAILSMDNLFYISALLPVKYYLNKHAIVKKAPDYNLDEPSRSLEQPSPTRWWRGIFSSYIRYFIYKTGRIPSHTIRNFVYCKILGVDIKKYVVIYYGAEIRNPHDLHIGNGTIIGDNVILDARNGIFIGKNVNLVLM